MVEEQYSSGEQGPPHVPQRLRLIHTCKTNNHNASSVCREITSSHSRVADLDKHVRDHSSSLTQLVRLVFPVLVFKVITGDDDFLLHGSSVTGVISRWADLWSKARCNTSAATVAAHRAGKVYQAVSKLFQAPYSTLGHIILKWQHLEPVPGVDVGQSYSDAAGLWTSMVCVEGLQEEHPAPNEHERTPDVITVLPEASLQAAESWVLYATTTVFITEWTEGASEGLYAKTCVPQPVYLNTHLLSWKGTEAPDTAWSAGCSRSPSPVAAVGRINTAQLSGLLRRTAESWLCTGAW